LKIYLEEDVNPLLARVLRERSFEAVSAHEAGHRALSDQELLIEASRRGCALLTHNIRDFLRLHAALSGAHAGIILANQQPFSELLKKTLRLLHQESGADAKGRVFWLSNF
jgi:predicted nuclease of predicted toxin-antitoxin system